MAAHGQVGLLRLTREHGFDDFLVLAMRHLKRLDPRLRRPERRPRRAAFHGGHQVAFWVPWQISW